MHRHFFEILSQNRDYVQTQCNNRNNPFHFACRKWYLYKYLIITRVQTQMLVKSFLYLYKYE